MYKYKTVHIIHNDKFIQPFIDFVAKNFNRNDHLYVFAFDDNVVKYPIPKADNVIDINNHFNGKKNIFKLSSALTSLIEDAEKVILHGLFSDDLINYLYLHQRFLEKCYWVMWGGDLYGHINPVKTWKNTFRIHRRRRVIQEMGGLITYIKGDYDLACKHYGVRGKHYESFMYTSNLYKDYNIKPKEHKTINILVGNSADPSNNHLEVFEKLLQYKDEDIKIIVPLSYSSQENAKKVIVKGREMFGDKFEPLTEYMPFEEYLKLLGKIDMAVFAHNRQQAMGNIITLLGLGKKVYIKNDITPWETFEDTGIKVFDVASVTIDLLEEDIKRENQKRVKEYFSEGNYLKQLNKLFEIEI